MLSLDKETKDNITTANFQALADGSTIIKVQSLEGNKTLDLYVTFEVSPQVVYFKDSSIAVLKGVDTRLDINNIAFYPENSTQRGINFRAVPVVSSSDNEVLDIINAQIAASKELGEMPLINVPDGVSAFLLEMYLDEGDSLDPESVAVVNVIEPMRKSEFVFSEAREITDETLDK
mgnify:CR=1 FL=1